jgi:hypothetical protein
MIVSRFCSAKATDACKGLRRVGQYKHPHLWHEKHKLIEFQRKQMNSGASSWTYLSILPDKGMAYW